MPCRHVCCFAAERIKVLRSTLKDFASAYDDVVVGGGGGGGGGGVDILTFINRLRGAMNETILVRFDFNCIGSVFIQGRENTRKLFRFDPNLS